MKDNQQIAKDAIEAANGIYARGETKSYEHDIKLDSYRNQVAVNLSPDCQVALLLEDAASVICQNPNSANFNEAVEMLEQYVAAKGIGYMCSI
jgi:exonuclease VII small subunit